VDAVAVRPGSRHGDGVVTARDRARQGAERLFTRLTQRVITEVERRNESRKSADLLVASVLAEAVETRSLRDPAAYVDVLRRSFLPAQFSVTELRAGTGEWAERPVQFGNFLRELESGVPALSMADALMIADIADELGASREPVGWVDVGSHFRRASSFARKGRVLQSAVRHVRAKNVLELGTAYGMSALFLASAVGKEGLVATVEVAQPQARIAGEVFAQHFADRIRPFVGHSPEILSEVSGVVPTFDLLFHDAEHSRDAYVADFAACEPMLAPGAVVIYDDIRWRGAARFGMKADTYDGWREVADHPRVEQAVEIDGEYGVLLLG
jgi:predicted O-methyltransferase YrrM